MFKFIFVLLAIGSLSVINAQTKFGDCPPDEGGPTSCVFDPKVNCEVSRFQCARGYKCCKRGCENVCAAILPYNGKHPGLCSKATGPRGQRCDSDSQCKNFEKCCDGNCRQVRLPTTPTKFQLTPGR